MATSTEKKYIDISINGNGTKGNAIYNNDALDNAIRLWLTASKNEFLRRQGGNVLLKHIGKPMNDDRVKLIKGDIQAGLQYDFTPKMTIVNLEVTPDYIQRKWKITLVAYSEELRVGVSETYLVSNE